MKPRLSILMGSVGDRLPKMCELYGRLAGQAAPYTGHVEIVVITDNRMRSIGMKRQALLDVARGDYVCYVDDDDDVDPGYVSGIMGAMPGCAPDVFVFPTLCISKEFGTMRVEHSIEFANEEAQGAVFHRKPWFTHPIRRELAQSSRFTDSSWGEDGDWLRPLWEKMKTEVKATDTPLYRYTWDDKKEHEK